MPQFDSTVEVNSPPSYDIESLVAEVKTAFGARFVDCNETSNGTKITAYVTGSNPADQGTLTAAANAHDGNAGRSARAAQATADTTAEAAVLTKLNLNADEAKALARALK